MYTRVVELTTKPGKARELSQAINDEVLPILKKQTGFVDEAVLVSDTESHRVLACSVSRQIPEECGAMAQAKKSSVLPDSPTKPRFAYGPSSGNKSEVVDGVEPLAPKEGTSRHG